MRGRIGATSSARDPAMERGDRGPGMFALQTFTRWRLTAFSSSHVAIELRNSLPTALRSRVLRVAVAAAILASLSRGSATPSGRGTAICATRLPATGPRQRRRMVMGT
jgi:hypothetical protein